MYTAWTTNHPTRSDPIDAFNFLAFNLPPEPRLGKATSDSKTAKGICAKGRVFLTFEKTSLFLSFPYVCPEPVLVK
jgi:hypothetical protein